MTAAIMLIIVIRVLRVARRRSSSRRSASSRRSWRRPCFVGRLPYCLLMRFTNFRLSIYSFFPFKEALVHATAAKSQQVKGHVGIANRAQAIGHLAAHLWFNQARHLRTFNLDTSDFVMMAHAQLMKTQLMEQFLSVVHHLQGLDINLRPISNTRRETGHRRLIPHRYTQVAGDCSYLTLAHASLFEWTSHGKFAGSTLARTKITIIIFIHAISNIAKIMFPGKWFQFRKEFIFTKVAAIDVIRGIAFVIKFVCCQRK